MAGKERLHNVKNAFAVMKDLKGLRLVLVDDVVTIGATVNECSKVLLKSGAASVTVLAVARSMPKYI